MKDFWYVHKLSSTYYMYRYSRKISLSWCNLDIEDLDKYLILNFRNDVYYLDKSRIKSVKTYDIREWNAYHVGLGYYNLEYLNLFPEITFTDYFYSLVFLHNLPILTKDMSYPSGLITEYRFEE